MRELPTTQIPRRSSDKDAEKLKLSHNKRMQPDAAKLRR